MKLTQIKSKIGFCGKGKTGVPREKPLGAEKRTNQINPHMTPSRSGNEPRRHWCVGVRQVLSPLHSPRSD